jgi:malonyl-CoA O-methyltransferase
MRPHTTDTADSHGPDRPAVHRAFRKAAPAYATRDFLHAEIRARLLERLAPINLDPQVLLDVGSGPPAATADFARRFPQARLLAIDVVPEMLGKDLQAWWRICADAAALPLPDTCADMVVASMTLLWCGDPAAVMAEARRVLRHPGLFAFATLGPDSLRELRRSWSATDSRSHTLAFSDMHDVGDALVRAGFVEPVLDTERLTITYGSLDGLVADLREVGAVNCSMGRRRSLTGRARWAAMTAAYETLRDASGVLPVTMEVIYGHAWAGEARGSRDAAPGDITVPLDRLGRRA